MNKNPYQKVCNSLERELKQVLRDINNLPKSSFQLITSKALSFFQEENSSDNYSARIESIISNLAKIRSKAKSSIDTLQMSTSENDSDSIWLERLTDIMLETDALLQQVQDRASSLDISVSDVRAKATARDLPNQFNVKIAKHENSSSQNAQKALDELLRQGVINQQEYNEKIRKISG